MRGFCVAAAVHNEGDLCFHQHDRSHVGLPASRLANDRPCRLALVPALAGDQARIIAAILVAASCQRASRLGRA